MDNKKCIHNDLEKLNEHIYICKNCSLIRMIELKKNNENKYNSKFLLSKDDYYNIKNEINILDLTKNALNMTNDFFAFNTEKADIFKNNSTLYLKFRDKIINHIYNLCSEIKSSYDCFYLSILLLDILIYKLNSTISNYQLDLYSTICFIISKKFIEKDELKREEYNQYLTICHSPQKFINSKDLILSEIECLKLLKYQINIPTSFTIMKYMFICGIIFENEISQNEYSNIYDECLDLLLFCNNNKEIAFYFNPVLIVFSVIYLIRKKYKLKFIDTLDLFSLFDIKFSQIKQCVKLISNLYFNKNELKNNNIDNKIIIKRSYSQSKISSEKNRKKYYTPNKYINFFCDKNYYIMSVKEYKKEKYLIKNDIWFFRIFSRKRNIIDVSIQISCPDINNFDYSINGNVILNINKTFYRNI